MNIDLSQEGKTNLEKRELSYPGVKEQLDMLWHAIDSGSLDTSSEFYLKLKEVKDKYPKT